MVVTRLKYTTDFMAGVQNVHIRQPLMKDDRHAHAFEITCTRCAAAQPLDGATVLAYFVRADGKTVPLMGSAEGSKASVTLTQACYTVPGRFSLVVKVCKDDVTNSIFWSDGTVHNTRTDEVIHDEDVLPSLDELLAKIAEIEASTDKANKAAKSAQAIADEVQEQLESGAFKGERGEPGEPGKPGDKGEPGEPGSPGAPGAPGYTPIKGVDYFDGAPGKDGAPGAPGQDGLSAPQIADTIISTDHPWSSKQIIDTLCRADTQSGDLVQGHWVAGYPLSGRLDIVARQEGEGDPSPDNIRPIVGVDSVGVTVCGENMFSIHAPISLDSGITYRYDLKVKPNTNYTCASNCYSDMVTANIYFNGGSSGSDGVWDGRQITKNSGPDGKLYVLIRHNNAPPTYYDQIVNGDVWVNVIEGNSAPNEPVPYHGTTHAIALPSTCYGGYIDWERGKLVQTMGIVNCGSMYWAFNDTTWAGKPIYHAQITDKIIGNMEMMSPIYKWRSGAVDPSLLNAFEIVGYKTSNKIYLYDNRFTNLSDFKTAINDVYTVYKLAAPIEYDLPALPTLSALDGVTTVYTDAGPVTITGRADPRHDYATMTDRLAALEAAATNV